jgi:hypothetical protein
MPQPGAGHAHVRALSVPMRHEIASHDSPPHYRRAEKAAPAVAALAHPMNGENIIGCACAYAGPALAPTASTALPDPDTTVRSDK